MKVISFSHNNGTSIRVGLDSYGEPQFIAADIAKELGYRDAHNMLRGIDDEDKGTQIVSTLGGSQVLNTINESGVYQAIFQSRKKEAKKIKRWVTTEVLPSIRKTGQYSLQQNQLSCADNYKSIKDLEQYIRENQYKIDYANAVMNGNGTSLTIAEYAKILSRHPTCKIGEKKLHEWFRKNKYFTYSAYMRSLPYQTYINRGYFEVKVPKAGGSFCNRTALITPLGQVVLAYRICKDFDVEEQKRSTDINMSTAPIPLDTGKDSDSQYIIDDDSEYIIDIDPFFNVV